MFGVQLRNGAASTQNNSNGFGSTLERDIGMKLARCAIFILNHHQQKLGIPCPSNRVQSVNGSPTIQYYNASRPGEYPKKRTGFLQSSVASAPTTIPELGKQKRVQIGYARAAFYGPVLEIMMKRLGLVRTLTDLIPLLSKIVGQPLRVLR